MQFFLHSSNRQSSFQIGLVLTLLVLAVGCDKKEKTTRPAPSLSQSSKPVNLTSEEPAPAPSAPVVSPTAATTEAPLPVQSPASKEEAENALRDLNFMVSEYRAINNRLPRDLNEFVERKYFRQLPAAPAGKRFRLDNASGKVVLENDK